MRHRLHLRLRALEKWLPDETKPHKALLPEWLTEDLRQQGIRFDASGLPEKSSMEANAPERIAPATPAPGPATSQLLWQSVMNAPSHTHRTKCRNCWHFAALSKTDQDVRKARNQLKNAEYTKANSDAREIPIRERRDRKRPDRSPSAGACFRCRIGLARERRPCPGARPRVDPG
jgi:hypothetical protein